LRVASSRSVSTMRLLSGSELQRQKDTMFPEKTVSEFLAGSARRQPEKMAYAYERVEHTWQQVDNRVNQLCRALVNLGIGKGDVVASCCHDGPVLVELLFACARIGAVRVGVNYRYAPVEARRLLEHCKARLMIVQDDFRLLAPDDGLLIVGCGDGQAAMGELADLMAVESLEPVTDAATESDIAQICYTTGSTGAPKGAIWTHRGLSQAMSHTLLDLGMTSRDTWLHCLPGAGVPSVLAVWNSVIGFTSVIMKGFDPVAVLRAIEKYEVTRTVWVPTMLLAVCQAAEAQSFVVSSLTRISYGSAPTPPALIRRALNTFVGAQFDQWYGSTEGAGGWFTQLTPEDHQRALAGEESLLESCGKPMHHADLQVVDELGAQLPPGVVGEICVRGPFVMEGYLGDPELSALTLAGGWLHTGDMGRVDKEGYVYLVDRKQFMIITGGYNVYPVEVENVLAGHPSVSEVCVFGVPDEQWGEVVQALVVLRLGATPGPEDLRSWCRQHLAAFKVPKSVQLQESLLRGPTGKVLKRVIRDQFVAQMRSEKRP
jgi:acyl-CoA synthetase (AMP-forming)/AMP-acid ligase II